VPLAPPATEKPNAAEQQDRPVDWFRIFATIALIVLSGMLILALFEPGLPYIVSNPRGDALDSEQFLRTLTALTDGHYGEQSSLEVLTNGESYYPAELEAIQNAQTSIHLEAYIFVDGEVTKRFLTAMQERARAGVQVRLVVDAVGSNALSGDTIDRFKAAGGEFAWYLPLRWYTWPRMNNRTHRELLIIDGKIAFVGGSGWADYWLGPTDKEKQRWRDTMIRVEGPAVTGLQAAFTENWLEAHGEVLAGKHIFPFESGTGDSRALVVRSSPTTGRSTTARVLFQVLIASARQHIYITTPYFLPDKSLRDELVHAIRERGAKVKIITPGPGTDHMLTRRSSRRLFGPLLEAGAEIYEYQPGMMHAKVLLIDSRWAVVGTTNLDPRSFTLNDEVNLATPDPRIAIRLEQDFFEDLKHSRRVSYEEWKDRGVAERVHELFGGLIERQQ
jgi:cardiolipin synthase